MLTFRQFLHLKEAKTESDRGKPGWHNDEAGLADIWNRYPRTNHEPQV